MITIEQAYQSLLNQTPLYYAHNSKVETLTPGLIGLRGAVDNAVYSHDYIGRPFWRGEDSQKQWCARGANSSTINLNDLFVNKQDVIDVIIALKHKEIEELQS